MTALNGRLKPIIKLLKTYFNNLTHKTMYTFFEEYKKFLLCLFFLILLLVVQAIFKHDFNDVINAVVNILVVMLGGGAVKFSVLKTSEREILNSSPVLNPDSSKYNTEKKGSGTIQSFIIAFSLSALISGSVLTSGCTSAPICTDCSKGPLSWQGEILGLTNGRYIETACFKFDMWKVIKQISVKDLSWEDLKKSITVEVIIKNGEFCSPDDKSFYKITLQSSEDDTNKKVIYTKSDAIIPIEPSTNK